MTERIIRYAGQDVAVPILGIWTPAPALRFLEDVGAVLPAAGAPDREALAEVYRRRNSVIG